MKIPLFWWIFTFSRFGPPKHLKFTYIYKGISRGVPKSVILMKISIFSLKTPFRAQRSLFVKNSHFPLFGHFRAPPPPNLYKHWRILVFLEARIAQSSESCQNVHFSHFRWFLALLDHFRWFSRKCHFWGPKSPFRKKVNRPVILAGAQGRRLFPGRLPYRAGWMAAGPAVFTNEFVDPLIL